LTIEQAVELVGRLLAARGSAQPHNPKGYVGTIARVLVQFPSEIARSCADPVHGINRESHFLPEAADVARWCEARLEPIEMLARLEFQEREQIAARAEGDAWKEDRKTRPTYEEIKKKYDIPPLPGLGEEKPPGYGPSSYTGLCERYGLSKIPLGWNAVDICRAAAKRGNGALLQAHLDANAPPTYRHKWANAPTADELRAMYAKKAPDPAAGPPGAPVAS
jgi:hypothetical protein